MRTWTQWRPSTKIIKPNYWPVPDQFLERAAKVEQFDLLYTKTIVAVKRLIIEIDPPGRTENDREEKPEVTTKIRLPDIPLPVFSGNLNECDNPVIWTFVKRAV
jgi:hypothetical protein